MSREEITPLFWCVCAPEVVCDRPNLLVPVGLFALAAKNQMLTYSKAHRPLRLVGVTSRFLLALLCCSFLLFFTQAFRPQSVNMLVPRLSGCLSQAHRLRSMTPLLAGSSSRLARPSLTRPFRSNPRVSLGSTGKSESMPIRPIIKK